jgi:catechol 2,3-dioxygenase-like lactoylglutathione lyase family enzyme
MKRFHVNVTVEDIAEAVHFYSSLFDAEPVVLKSDYAKWMLDDPRINFAISIRGEGVGVNHLGMQVDSAEELAVMRAQLVRADNALVEQSDAACCYAKSNKYWITDPAGIAWETFHTLSTIPIYGADTEEKPTAALGCCDSRRATASACC